MKKNTFLLRLLIVIMLIPLIESCKKVEKIQHDMMDYSMNKIGDTFFSLLPESQVKTNLRKEYDSFVQRSINGEVNQGQIEYVAANMMNASNSFDTIKPELASSIMESTQQDNNILVNKQDNNESYNQVLIESQRRSLGEKLSKILEFNDKLKLSYKNDDISKKVFYKFENEIVINLDEELKTTLNESDELLEEFKYFEINKDFKWVKDLSKNLELEKAIFEKEMKKLADLKINLNDLVGIDSLKYVKFSDTNFISPYIPKINMDSIMKSVEQKLKAAGLKEAEIINK